MTDAPDPIVAALNEMTSAIRGMGGEIHDLRLSTEERLDTMNTRLAAIETEMHMGFNGLMDGLTDLRNELRRPDNGNGNAAA
jgi:hypothetical protein